VAEFGERFFRDVVAKDRQDLTIPRRYFDKSIVLAIGTKAVRDVTTEDVRAIIRKKKDEGFDAAAGNIRSVLRSGSSTMRKRPGSSPRTRCSLCRCATSTRRRRASARCPPTKSARS